jgi:hypothetical protein
MNYKYLEGNDRVVMKSEPSSCLLSVTAGVLAEVRTEPSHIEAYTVTATRACWAIEVTAYGIRHVYNRCLHVLSSRPYSTSHGVTPSSLLHDELPGQSH